MNFVQVGIDLGGMVRAGHPGWTGFGGHGSGRKLPIVFAGLLLGDDQLAHINKSFPKVQLRRGRADGLRRLLDRCQGGLRRASGIDAATGVGRSRGNDWGPYEHTPPAQWKEGQNTSESYRRCCTSIGWVAQALALRLMHAEKAWGHDAFFDYVDRWMFENDADLRQDDQGGDRQGPRQGLGTPGPGLGRVRQRDVGHAPDGADSTDRRLEAEA